ncbi:hypothetical protein GCM10025863_30640 [Microbacterium suwonense]|uniref:Uncharacterized protein n=1 Tax=Microbacterium suwonense TaxID=683047 RepID=A0ABM8FXS7_9MICO|nr:hypothetical protein GCM10025863_30640 [Microbacterium suwonense]
MAELSRGAVVAAQHAALQHEASPHALADVEEDEVLPTASRTQPRLGERREIRRVVEEDGLAQPAVHHLDDVHAGPAAQDPAPGHPARCPVDGGRHRHAHAAQLIEAGLEVREDVGQQQRRTIQLIVSAVIPRERHVVLAEDGAVDIGDEHAQLARGDVDASDQSDRAGERHESGTTPAADAGGGAQHSRCGQLLDDVRHGCRREPRRRRQLDLRETALLLDRGHDATSIGFTQ